MKDLELFNISLLSKWKWRFILDRNTVWRKLLAYRYGLIVPTFTCDEFAIWGRKDSILWRDLKQMLTYPKPCFLQVLVACWEAAQIFFFWHHRWLGLEPLKETFPTLYAIALLQHDLVAEHSDWMNLAWSWRCYWFRPLAEGSELVNGQMLDCILQDVKSQ